MQHSLTIAGTTFALGDRVATPSGPGAIHRLEPLASEEIMVQLDTRAYVWFSHRVVTHLPTAYMDPLLVAAARAAYAAGVCTGGGWPCEEEADPELARFIGWLRTDYLGTLETRQACAEPRRIAPSWLLSEQAKHP